MLSIIQDQHCHIFTRISPALPSTYQVINGLSFATECSLTEPSSDPAKKKDSPKGQNASELHEVVESSSGKVFHNKNSDEQLHQRTPERLFNMAHRRTDKKPNGK